MPISMKMMMVMMMMMMMIVFVVRLTDERRLVLFPAGTIVRDLHHLSPTSNTPRAGIEPAQSLSSGFVE